MTEVRAAFVMVASLSGEVDEHAKAVEGAMLDALRKAQAEGISDPDTLRRLMLEARDALWHSS